MSGESRNTRSFDDRLDWAIRTYFSNRQKDVADAKQIIADALQSGEVAGEPDPVDLVNEYLLGRRNQAYLTVRAWTLQILRDPGRIGTMSTGERLTMALMFERVDWLRGDTFAGAAQRAGMDLVNAIVRVESDLRLVHSIKVRHEPLSA